jgi:hypothetical protein
MCETALTPQGKNESESDDGVSSSSRMARETFGVLDGYEERCETAPPPLSKAKAALVRAGESKVTL